MPIDVETGAAPQLLIFRVHGEWPTLAESQQVRGRLIDEGKLTPSSRALIDVRDAKVPSYSHAQSIVAAAIREGGLPHVRAYLVESAVQFGFSRQLQLLSPGNTRIEIFTNEQEALMWLNSPSNGPPGQLP